MNKNYDIIIFGAGIAGLTVAHELCKYNLKIAIIEKENIIGGMARSSRYSDNLPTEHSWRGYAPFYTNTFNIMKEIYTSKNNKTVYNNLTKDIQFINFENKINLDKNVTYYDNLIIMYWLLYHIVSGNLRSEDNKERSFTNLVNSISKNAKKKYIASIGPGLGLDAEAASVFHIGKYIEMLLFNSDLDTNWFFMNQPTSEAWFDPWYTHLIHKHVDFYVSTELKELTIKNNGVINAKVNDSIISGENYVIAMNPYSVADLYKNNKLGNDSELAKFIDITIAEPHIQISFRIGFAEKIHIPDRDAFIFPDSNLNLTIYQQDSFWLPDINLGNNIKSLWSGTACVTYKTSELYNKPCDELTKDEFLNEVLHEITNSAELDEYLIKNKNKKFKDLTIVTKEIWYEWEYKNNHLESRNKKWVNTLNNNSRPLFTTKYDNLFITGAHCNTGLSIWSMESAVESGKRCAIKILDKLKIENKITLYKHSRPLPFLYKMDDTLYKLKLPNIIDLTIIVICVFTTYSIVSMLFRNNSKTV
jgi:uncharacterized protein with NAD-binding domain and iron-sulfur cluster